MTIRDHIRLWWYAVTVQPSDMYDGEHWRRLSLAIRYRDRFRCQYRRWPWSHVCGRSHDLAVHHRWPWRSAQAGSVFVSPTCRRFWSRYVMHTMSTYINATSIMMVRLVNDFYLPTASTHDH